MAGIVLTYTTEDTATTYTTTFSEFLDGNLPRSHNVQSAFNFSTRGTSIITGPSYIEKRIWTIASLISRTQATYIETMYRQWDQDRAAGHPARITLEDSTFGSTVTANVVITQAPVFSMLSYNHWEITMGLTEV